MIVGQRQADDLIWSNRMTNPIEMRSSNGLKVHSVDGIRGQDLIDIVVEVPKCVKNFIYGEVFEELIEEFGW